MLKVIPYLTFSGNCREALSFYKECLGGELMIQTVGESPMSKKLPAKMKNTILHASLSLGDFLIMASEMVDEKGLSRGNSVSLMLDCGSEEQLKHAYEKLSEGGEKTHPIELTFWGALFGDLRDKYGINWRLHYQKSPIETKPKIK